MSLPQNLRRGLSSGHMPALDALRAFAVFLVVFYHLGYAWVPGGLGVLIFFVLSGFLITTLLLRENRKYHAVSLRLFYLRRSLRIFPAFSVYWLLIVGGRMALHKHIVWGQAWAALFYVNDYYQAIHGDPNTALSHTWSLGIEEQFYILWPVTFLWLRRDLKKAAASVAGFIVCLELYRFVLYFAGVDQGYFYEAFDTRADSLLVGCLLAILLQTGQDGGEEGEARRWAWLCDRPWKPLVPIALLGLSSAAALRWGTTWRDLFGFLLEPWLVAVLIAQCIAQSTVSPAWRWLNAAPLAFLGRLSYSIYLYQQVVVVFATVPFPHNKTLATLAAVVAVVAVAGLSYSFVELPFLRLKDRLARAPH